jgi:hypothetical protein
MTKQRRAQLRYTEPPSTRGTWTCPPTCFESAEAATEYREALNGSLGRRQLVAGRGPCGPRDCETGVNR